ncbi:MAG: hypothetical protein P8X69_05535, partial [Maritimibacter sp.]
MTPLPYHITGESRDSRWLITCDHASNRVPEEISGGSLGLPAEDMARHIAYDPGERSPTGRRTPCGDVPHDADWRGRTRG